MSLCAPAHACDAHTPLENAYCLLKSKGASLPPLNEFRRNPEATQRLLLKRPAQRLKVTLPKPSDKASIEHRDVQFSKAQPSKTPSPKASSPKAEAVSRCELRKTLLMCGQQRFALQTNKRNGQLAADALSASNRLWLEPATSADVSSLVPNYERYIRAMLSIGLAGATMSFTKFHYVWQQAELNQQNPVQRFAQLFEHLKQDRRSLPVNTAVPQALPQSIAWCSRLNVDTWVCDQKQQNWIYQRSP